MIDEYLMEMETHPEQTHAEEIPDIMHSDRYLNDEFIKLKKRN